MTRRCNCRRLRWLLIPITLVYDGFVSQVHLIGLMPRVVGLTDMPCVVGLTDMPRIIGLLVMPHIVGLTDPPRVVGLSVMPHVVGLSVTPRVVGLMDMLRLVGLPVQSSLCIVEGTTQIVHTHHEVAQEISDTLDVCFDS